MHHIYLHDHTFIDNLVQSDQRMQEICGTLITFEKKMRESNTVVEKESILVKEYKLEQARLEGKVNECKDLI